MALASAGQTAKPKPAPKKTGTTAKPVPATLKNAVDSFSYAVGLSMAGFYKEQGVQNINTSLVIKALNDVKNGKPLLDESQINNCIVSYMTSTKSEKAAGSKKEGEAFLAANKSKPGVVTLASGLQYQVIKEGTGPKPALTDKVKVHYEGSLLNGKIFDSSIQRGEPIELNVNGVIPGWTEALQLMPVGSKWKLFIPSDLAYGDNGAGADIKPGSTLLFDVELLDIVK
jgi:FKBP-type peptidyl-prolyl cis-trans isomerase FklB